MFIRPQGYTQYVLVSNTEYKYNFCLFTTAQYTFKISSTPAANNKKHFITQQGL